MEYDLLVIGAGSGGLAAAKRAASYGAKVAIAEEDLVGGTCVVRGCIPKKLMVYASQFSQLYADAASYGWEPVAPQFDWPKLVAAVDREVRRLSTVHIGLLEQAGVTLVQGRAVFVEPHIVAIGQTQLSADKILIAVGSEAILPSIPGIEHVLVSRQMFQLLEQPRHLAIVGGGYIGVEFASIMSGLGSQVTQIIRRDLILQGFDQDIRAHVQAAMQQHGITILPHTHIEAIDQTATGLQLRLSHLTQPQLSVDAAVLFATGRTPNTAGIGLEQAGVKTERGAILVNPSFQTTQPHIFAVGDCTNRVMLTPVAIAEGRAFADAQFGHAPRQLSYQHIPTAVFSQPEVGCVGLNEADAQRLLGEANVAVYRSRFRPLLHSLTGASEKTLIKLVVDRQSDRILGAHMAGKDAAEIIQAVAIALTMGATKQDFDATMALHPTSAEEFVTMR